MFQLFLTPASISYLTQVILCGVIFAYLVVTLQRRSAWNGQARLITAFFASLTVFIGLLFFETTLAGAPRLSFLYVENIALALALTFLLQFAYHFPVPYARHGLERRTALGIGILYTSLETLIAVYRLVELVGKHQVHFRPPEPDYLMGILLAGIPIAFLRQSLADDARPLSWIAKLRTPQNSSARRAREFALIYSLLILLGLVNLLRTRLIFPEVVYNLLVSVGSLVIIWLFASRYVGVIPGGTSVQVKISANTLTLLLATLGILGWVISPAHANAYRPQLEERQTLRFLPAPSGGYEMTMVDFSFEQNLGERTSANPIARPFTQTIPFDFPFYGKTYTEAQVASFGTLIFWGAVGEVPPQAANLQSIYSPPGVSLDDLKAEFVHRSLQSCCFEFPAIFPLAMNFATGEESAVYVLREGGRMVITWFQLPAFHSPEEIYTFQVSLYQDGVFELTYADLPDSFSFYADGQLTASPVLRGMTPGRGESQTRNRVGNLALAGNSGPGGVTQHPYLDFRAYMHRFLLPLAWLVLAASAALLVILPWMMSAFITRPLQELLEGVQQMEAGNLDVTIEAQYRDDIGFLARAFNRMAANLRETIASLDQQVTERTAELASTNEQLQAELFAREQAQSQLLEQQRALAALDERQRLGRDLHDSVNQSIHSLVLFSETLTAALEKGDPQRTRQIALRLQESARQALKETRLLLYQLRPLKTANAFDLLAALEARLDSVERRAGMDAQVLLDGDLAGCHPDWMENLYGILLESLNNSLKHAQAQHLVISLACRPGEITLEVADDGRGFDPLRLRGSGMGLQTMRERADLLGGQISIISNPGSGTRVIFSAGKANENGQKNQNPGGG